MCEGCIGPRCFASRMAWWLHGIPGSTGGVCRHIGSEAGVGVSRGGCESVLSGLWALGGAGQKRGPAMPLANDKGQSRKYLRIFETLGAAAAQREWGGEV